MRRSHPGRVREGLRSGFWGVKPRSLSHALSERGLNRMANSSSINWASRGAVHNSVANPCSAGLPRSHRRAIFS